MNNHTELNDTKLLSLVEHRKFYHLFKHEQLKEFLPEPFQAHSELMSRVKGSPLYGILGAMVDCGSGLFLFALGGILAKSFTSLNPLERYILAASPMLTGGGLRIWAAARTERGRGKETILGLLGMSLLGVLGNVIMLSTDIDLSKVNTQHAYYYVFLLNNILSGVGIATYSAGMALGAQAAPQDNPKDFLKHIELSSRKLGKPIHLNCTEKLLAPILRSKPPVYLALIACISNFAPGMTLISAYFLVPSIGLRNTYIFFSGMTGLGILTTWFCVENAIFDQLKKINPQLDSSLAKQIAMYMGQKNFAQDAAFFKRLKTLTPYQKSEIITATIDYSLTFGLLSALTAIGPIILERKGASSGQAVLSMAGVSILSSLMRGLMNWAPNLMETRHWMLISLMVMFGSSVILKCVDELPYTQFNLFIFGLFNGIGNFCVVDRVSQKIPKDIGLATGISSGIAAFLAFPMSILLAQEEWGLTGVCALGLVYNLYQMIVTQCEFISQSLEQNIEMTQP